MKLIRNKTRLGSRRNFIHRLSVAGLGAVITHPMLERAVQAQDGFALPPLNRFPRMLQEYYVGRMRENRARRLTRFQKISSGADARAYVEEVREKIRECFGAFPEKTPLNPKITGVIEREAFRIEKILFESRPGFLVTANLYLPKGRPFPLPGVVGTCGHSNSGKAYQHYQAFSQGLARQGYVVLTFDPIGQGERLQYVDEDLKSRVGVGVMEHLLAGNQQFLVNEFIGSWRAWDGIRALDYLLTREEVDPAHLGVTGNSGGGTMTTWLCGLERRWTMAAPSCFVTTFGRNLENELPADTEQCPPQALALGLDHEDFLAAMAPRPIIVLAKERDFFDIRGTEEAFGRLKHLYRLLGAPDDISLFTGPTDHGYSRENREAMYRWFNRCTGISDAQTEPPLEWENERDLWCTPGGQVATLSSRTVFSFTREKARRLKAERGKPSPDDLRKSLHTLLDLNLPETPPDYRILRTLPSRKYPLPYFTTYALTTEPGIQTILYVLGKERHEARPPRRGQKVLLYVSHHSSDAELREEPQIRRWIAREPESLFCACDLRGVGESRPDTCGQDSFLKPYGSDYFYAIHGLMMKDPCLAQKTRDLLRVVQWLHSYGYQEIHLLANGWGTLPATLAAFLADSISQVTLKGALRSFQQIAETEYYTWPLSSFIPDILSHFDWGDIHALLKETKSLDFVG